MNLRLATPGDVETLWHWRNDVSTRKELYGNRAMSFEGFISELTRWLNTPTLKTYMAVVDGIGPVGFVQVDKISSDTATIIVAIAKNSRQLGYGKMTIKMASDKTISDGTAKMLVAVVREQNYKALLAFESAGYKEVGNPSKDIVEMGYGDFNATL